MTNYIVDIVILAVILLFIFVFAYKGLVESIFKSCSWIISLVATYMLYPIISGILRQTFIFDAIKKMIYSIMNLDAVATESGAGQISTINSLSLPDVLKNMLVDNNNSVIYELLGVNSLKDYVAGYIGNIILNIVVSAIVFIVIIIIIKAISGTLQLAVKLPIIKQINGLGGGLLGLFWSIVFIWAVMALSTVLIATPIFSDIVMAIDNSIVGKFLYDNNVIMNVLLTKLFGWG